jgi:hypothetical protein
MTTKKQSGYVMPLQKTLDEGGLNCQNCYYYKDFTCSIVKGKIDPLATCNLWTRTGPLNFDFISGQDALNKLKKSQMLNKLEAGYTDARHTISIKPSKTKKGVRCDSCIHFLPPDENKVIGKCEGVKGDINRNACCNLWTDTKDTKLEYASGEEIKQILDIEDLYKF